MCADRRHLAVLTTGRQDFGILRSPLMLLRKDPRFALSLWVGGMHLNPRFGEPTKLVRDVGIPISREINFLGEPPDETRDYAIAIRELAAALKDQQPDALLLLGDRTETLAAATAALLTRTPVAHLHGGEESEGAIDNACRHAITKLSHLHLVSHEVHASRVIQMGEPPDSVVVVGAAGLDNLSREDLATDSELSKFLGHPLPDPIVLVTMHPTTLGAGSVTETAPVSAAMADVDATYVITAPNSDAGGDEIRKHWLDWAKGKQNAVFANALGERLYWTLLRRVKVVLGNSSSGIVEAPAAGAAVINVGDRQKGRLRYGHVVDVESERTAIQTALRTALDSPRPRPTRGSYPEGLAAPRIVDALARWSIVRPPRKSFRDLECHQAI